MSGHLSVRLTHHDPGSNVRVEVGDDGAVWLWLAIADDVWVEVRAPRAVPVPETERVPWWEAVGRVVPDVGTIREVGMSGDQVPDGYEAVWLPSETVDEFDAGEDDRVSRGHVVAGAREAQARRGTTPAPPPAPSPVPPWPGDENDDTARLSPDQGDRIVNACCRMLGCEPADIDGDAALEEILTEAVERCADLHGQDRWEDDCHGCGFRVGDHTTDGRCPAPATPVPPWPGAVLSGLVDEDGEPTWLAQAGQVRGEQVRGWRDMAWYRPHGHSSDTWVEVRAPRAVPAAPVTVTIPAETAHALLRYIEDGDYDTDYVIDRLADLLIAAMDGDQ